MSMFQHHTRDKESLADPEKSDSLREIDESEPELGNRLQAAKRPSSQLARNSVERSTNGVTPQQRVNATDWNGSNDPDNPHNWAMSQRVYHAVTPALFGFAV